MADTDKSLQILIEFIARTQGADAAKAALAEVKEHTSSAAASTKELGTSQESLTNFQKDSASPAQEEWNKKTEEGGGQADMFAGKQRELHRLFGEMNRILPGTGELLRAIFHPSLLTGFIAAVAGIAAGFMLWTKRVNELVEAMTGIALPDFSGHAGSVAAAAKSWKEYADEVARGKEDLAGATANATARIRLINGEIEQIKKLQEARKQLELAAATTPGQKREIEVRYAGKATALDKEQRDRILAEKNKQADALEKEAQAPKWLRQV